jgi:hypothetical protein
MKTTNTTIRRSPRPSGQTNQPPPLEYPTAKHPDSPHIETQLANTVHILVTRAPISEQ